MEYKHKLPTKFIEKALSFEEFANGGAQATVVLFDGRVFHGVLIANATAIVAIRSFESLPFKVDEISDIYQIDEDINPKNRRGWNYWDDWRSNENAT
jgi:hypothetical protein